MKSKKPIFLLQNFSYKKYGDVKRRPCRLAFVGLVCANFAPVVLADDIVQRVESKFVIEEVTVTARKREESLQDTPISISAFSKDELTARGVGDLSAISDFTPNLLFETGSPNSGSSVAASVYIRGIGQSDFLITTDPGVGLYVDGVYLGRSVGAVLDLGDVQRVEVLRGPQGTLFGRNTIGGAINIISSAPEEEFNGYLDLTVGEDDRFDVKGVINLPISETLLSRISFASKDRDGYVKRLGDGLLLGDEDKFAARANLLWTPNDEFSANFIVDGSRAREESPANVLAYADGLAPIGSAHNFVINGASCAAAPLDTSNMDCFNAQWITKSNYSTYATSKSKSNYDVLGASLILDYQFSWGNIKSITAYRDMEAEFRRDPDHSPHLIFDIDHNMNTEQLSQELQVGGESFGNTLNWLIGGYYYNEKGSDVNVLPTVLATFLSGGEVESESLALYGQATYSLTDRLSLTLGVRYTDDEKDYLPDSVVLDPGILGIPVGTLVLPHETKTISSEEVTPLFNLSYHLTEEWMIYANYSEGFKSGGFNARVFPPRSEIPSFDPEYVKSYEVGFKATAWDRRLRLNGALYYTDYDDLQVVIRDSIGSNIQNAAKAIIQGAELETTVLLTDNLVFGFGVGYTDAEYDEVDPRATFSKNDEIPFIPKLTTNASLSYDMYLSSIGGTVTPRIDWSYRSEVYYDAVNEASPAVPTVIQGGYSLTNLSVQFSDDNEKWNLKAGVNNVANKEYFNSGYINRTIGFGEKLYQRTREWYLSVRYSF